MASGTGLSSETPIVRCNNHQFGDDPVRRLLTLLLFAVAIIATATAHIPDTLTLTFLDVGQGDSILVQAPNGRTMLVDTGESWAAPAVRGG